VRLSVASPAPVFLSPLGSLQEDGAGGVDVQGAPHVKATVAAIAGCQVSIPVVAADPTSAGLTGPDAAARGYKVHQCLPVFLLLIFTAHLLSSP
jgi:hypothetical protein